MNFSKYLEYIWLLAALLLVGVLVVRFENMDLRERILYGGALALAAFNYNFRRLQRIKQQKADKQEQDKQEQDKQR